MMLNNVALPLEQNQNKIISLELVKDRLQKNDEVKLLRFNHPSAIKPEKLIPLIKNNSVEVIEKSRLESVILANKKKDTITVLTGSLYAIGEVYKDIEKLKIAQLGNIQ